MFPLKAAVGIVMLAVFSAACPDEKVDAYEGEDMMAASGVEEVLAEHTKELMSIPGVVGTAQGLCSDRPCIKVYVIRKTAELERKIPDNIEGCPVMMEEVGEIRALPENRK